MNNLSVNTIRMISVNAISKAKSGHPGMVLGSAPMMYTLWNEFLNADPKHPNWFNRDRFILASGHASSMLYTVLHLSGYNISMDDMKNFRQLGSMTPGHPEYGHTEGIDATSGPLGQGIAMGAGMAVAESFLAEKYNKENYDIINHYTYVLCGDGDLQEGVTQEAMSLAGHLGLGKLIVIYDSNDVQLDGPVSNANSENVKEKYTSMNWQYIKVDNPNDLESVKKAIKKAQKETTKPTIIECKTVIGYGTSLAGDSACHGAPLPEKNVEELRESLDYHYADFEVPEEVYDDFKNGIIKRGKAKYNAWTRKFNEYKNEYPELAKELLDIINDNVLVPSDVLPSKPLGTSEASRVTGGAAIKTLSKYLPHFVGGSADLTKSTNAKGADGDFTKENRLGRNINFGVREHAMAAMVNGLTLHHIKAFSGGFFVFSDYLKPSIRMAALMNIPSIFVFTHDSVAVGEDGPTHQPIEQLVGLRAIPNVNVFRPGDANETNACFLMAVNSKNTPSVICLSRQNLKVEKEIKYEDVAKGAYVISDVENYQGIIIASGSEVGLALDAQKVLLEKGYRVRVVSMVSWEVFDKQTKKYQKEVLPPVKSKRLSIEMGSTLGWQKYAKENMGIDTFGVSAPLKDVVEHFGFNVQNVVERMVKILK